MNDTLIGGFAKFLEYGLPGLSAIMVVLGYLLLRNESKKSEPSPAILRSTNAFMGFAVALLLVSGILGVTSRSPTPDLAEDAAYKRAMAFTATSLANTLEGHLLQSRGKLRALPSYPGLDSSEVTYRLMRRAVFLDLMLYSADSQLLSVALAELRRRDRISEGLANRLIAELPELKKLKLQWLTDSAIPAVEQAIADMRDSPVQAIPGAEVPLPNELSILPNQPANERVQDVERLREEQRMLREQG